MTLTTATSSKAFHRLQPPSRVLSATEGLWLDALRELSTPWRLPVFKSPPGPFPDDDVIDLGIHRLAVTCTRILFHDGQGHLQMPVLRNRLRLRGSMLDADVNDGFQLRFSLATRDAWFGLARGFPELTKFSDHQRLAKRVARESIIVDDTLTGDWLFFFLIASGLQSNERSVESLSSVRRRLRMGSPLTALGELCDVDDASLDKLLGAPQVRLVELSRSLLVKSWLKQFSLLINFERETFAFATRAEELADALERWLAVLKFHHRLDLACSVLDFFVEVSRTFEIDKAGIRAKILDRIKGPSGRDRDRVLAPMERLFQIAMDLLDQRNTLAQVGYGDERYYEAQVFLEVFDAIAPEDISMVRNRYREIRGSIG